MEEMKREVELDCDTDRAWQALTEEQELEQWLGGEVEADLKPGGDLTVRDADGSVREGFFESVEPGRKLSFWWTEQSEAEPSRVELTIEEAGEGCRLRVVETRPMVGLEEELVRIASAGPGTGPIAAAHLTCV